MITTGARLSFEDLSVRISKLIFSLTGVFSHCFGCSEHDKSLSNVTLDSLLLYSEHVESNSLGNWSALTDGDDITDSGSGEHWGQVSWQVAVSLLEPVVLFDVMQVVSSQHHSSVHLIRKDDALEDSSSDGYIRCEWALLVNVHTIFSFKRGLETETDFL